MTHASSRRQFVKIAAASVAAPFILPSRVWSAETAPNARLNLGFIGVGKMNSGHLNNFLGRKEVQVVAVCDVDTNRRENAKKTVEERYGSHRWMFIPNTLHLGELYVSEDLVPEIAANPVCRIAEKPIILTCQNGRQQLSFASL